MPTSRTRAASAPGAEVIVLYEQTGRYPIEVLLSAEPASADADAGEKLKRDSTLSFEPITAATVALFVGAELAKGAIAYVGGELLRNILGHPGIKDIAKMLRQAVEEMKRFVRAELQRQLSEFHAKEMERDLAAARDALERYSWARTDDERAEASEDLRHAQRKAADVLHLAADYGLSATWVYLNAVSVELLAMGALYSRKRHSQWLMAIQQRIEKARAHLVELRAALHRGWANPDRLGPLVEVLVQRAPLKALFPGGEIGHEGPGSTGRREPPPPVKKWAFDCDGRRSIFDTKPQAESARSVAWAAIEKDAARRTAEAFTPVDVVVGEWGKIRQDAARLLADAEAGAADKRAP